MICKQTITERIQDDMQTNNCWAYAAWYVNKLLLGVCSMICKQTIAGRIYHDM